MKEHFVSYTALLSFLLIFCIRSASGIDPHIIFIVADDMGWHDIGWNNPDIQTPNLDDMAEHGVILNNSYVQMVCSPSRAAFLSGRYPFKLGLQVGSIASKQPKYLPTDKELLPEKLQSRGYSTHMVGKWHLGFCNTSLTPPERGFDTFVGFYNGHEDYLTHMKGNGYDFRFNHTVYDDSTTDNVHSTYIFADRAKTIIEENDPDTTPLFLYLAFQAPHTPLQVPDSYKNMYSSYSWSDNRKIFAGMVTMMDEAIGNITDALETHGYMNNTIIIFTSDNGGQFLGGGSNYPLRGTKGTYWEGGARVPTMVYSKTLLTETGYTNTELFHATDWYPTILSMAGVDSSEWSHVDGYDQWECIKNDNPTNREWIVYNLDYSVYNYSAIRNGTWKFVTGDISPDSNKDGWYDVDDVVRRKRSTDEAYFDDDFENTEEDDFESNHPLSRRKRSTGSDELYNLVDDPTESNNVYSSYPDVVADFEAKLAALKLEEVEPFEPAAVTLKLKKDYGGNWSPGWCTVDR